MTSEPQRYCPSCERAFLDGEPVLRCPACDQQQHPTCWVSAGGCLTEGHDDVGPVAEAYDRGSASAPVAGPDDDEPDDPDDEDDTAAAPMIGAGAAGVTSRTRPMQPPRPAQNPQYPQQGMAAGPPPRSGRAAPPVQSRRHPDPGELGKPSPGMPRVYDRGGIMRFWYVPVGILLAVAVAFGVVWGVDRFTGDDGGTPADPDPTPTTTVTAEPTDPAGGGATTSPTPPVETTTTPEPGDSAFAIGDTVTVQGTGNCLNIRSEAGLDGAVVDCLDDGTQLDLLEGPVAVDDLNWWRIQGPASTGWGADLYFVPAE